VPVVGNDPTLNRLEVSYKKNSYEENLISVGSAHLSKTTLSS
jgi:hypothetical protein